MKISTFKVQNTKILEFSMEFLMSKIFVFSNRLQKEIKYEAKILNFQKYIKHTRFFQNSRFLRILQGQQFCKDNNFQIMSKLSIHK